MWPSWRFDVLIGAHTALTEMSHWTKSTFYIWWGEGADIYNANFNNTIDTYKNMY